MIKSPVTLQKGEAGLGIRPFVFDIIAPDGVTSLLPDDLKMVLHVNPSGLDFSYSKIVSREQTMMGWVETYFGDGVMTINLENASGAFIRPYTGLSAITGPVAVNGTSFGTNIGGTRRDTITYDKYLDSLALFHNNGSIYDDMGNVALQGRIKMSFDGGTWFGWFQSFSVTDSADSPYQFKSSLAMQVERESHGIRTQNGYTPT
jgi:hypothetical protein